MTGNQFKFSKGLRGFAALIKNEGATLYAVGGMVRNTLLGLPVSDVDVCSALTPDNIVSLCKRNGLRVIPKGMAYGTVEIHWGSEKFEHTTFRSDQYAKGGTHRPTNVMFSDSLETDAFRRDFSVNAIYVDILSGELFDPTGGLHDLNNRLLRTTSNDPSDVLSVDALRIMRLIRLAAELNFDIEPATFMLAKSLINNLKQISPQRITSEFNKILMCDIKYGQRSAEHVFHGLELFDKIGALDLVFPELSRGRGLAQKPTHHRYDVLNHCLHTASEAKPDLILRLAGLLHDVGKPYVHERTGTMHDHDYVGEIISREILIRMCYDRHTISEVPFIIRNHMYDLNNTAKDSTLRVRFVLWGYERSLEMAEIREADVHGSGVIRDRVKSADRWRELLRQMVEEETPFSVEELHCSGCSISEWLKIPPSPIIGEIKLGLLKHCARFPQDNNFEKLRKLAKDLAPNEIRGRTARR